MTAPMHEISLHEVARRTGQSVKTLYGQAAAYRWRYRDADMGELHDCAYTRLFRTEDMSPELRRALGVEI